MKIFLLAASLRKDSVNKKLINICAEHLKPGHQLDIRQMSEFDVPLYDGDIETGVGVPANAVGMAKLMQQADKIIFSVPEYNHSTPGVFKNLIDWVSRIRPMPWTGMKILLISASPSAAGGQHAYEPTKVALETCGAIVYPKSFSLNNAYEAFDAQGKVKDDKRAQDLYEVLDEFVGS